MSDPREPYVARSQVRIAAHAGLLVAVMILVCLPAPWTWWLTWLTVLAAVGVWHEIDWHRYLTRPRGGAYPPPAPRRGNTMDDGDGPRDERNP